MVRLRIWLLILAFIKVTSGQNEEGPRLEILPLEPVRKNIGKNVILQCTAIVPNKDLVSDMYWEGPNGKEIPSLDRKIETQLSRTNANALDLLISNLQKEDTGLYKCFATYASNQVLVAEKRVTSFIAITFLDVQDKQTPIIYTDAKIKCLVQSDPPPEVDWVKNDQLIMANDPRYITQQDGILIKNITEADEGVYKCRARVAAMGDIDQRDIQVEVHIPPTITGSPADVAGKEKASVALQCIATGTPAPSYSWVNKDGEVLNGKEGFYVDELRGELQIMDLRPEHTGNYRCTASNPAGDVTAEAYLTVLTKPRVEEFKNITIGEDDNAELRCIVTGDPLPDAVFRKESNPEPFITGVNSDNRIKVVQSEDHLKRRVGILKISGTNRTDDGLYSCKGVSGGGVTERWGHITVEFQPTFETQLQDEFWSWEQQPVNLSCLATSIPNATVSWYIRNEPIREEDPNYKILSHGPNGVLNVTPIGGGYFDTYTCRATNTQGTKDKDVTLKQVEKPGPVSAATPEKITATTVSWLIRPPLSDGGLEIEGYHYQFKIDGYSWEDNKVYFWAKDSTYVVDDLRPQAQYIFRFAAKNRVGMGTWSGEKTVTMKMRDAPEDPILYNAGPDKNVAKAIPYPDHYNLQWQVPADNGEVIDFFQIVYYKVVNKTGKWESAEKKKTETVKYPNSGGSKYRIEPLESDSNYRIELRAHNVIGFSRPAEMTIKTSFDTSAASNRARATGETSGTVPTGASSHGIVALLCSCFCCCSCLFHVLMHGFQLRPFVASLL